MTDIGESQERRAAGLDLSRIEGRRRARARMWRDVMEREERSERSRVVPLPLALAAVILPFVAAWASASTVYAPERGPEARPLPEPLRALGREDRAPAEPGRYVDVWGPVEPWEAELLERRGHVRPAPDPTPR